MKSEKKSVFEKFEEKLENLVGELETVNSFLYAAAAELFDIAEKVDSLNAKADALVSVPLRVEVDYDRLSDAIVMAFGFKEVGKEMFPEFKFKKAGE